MNTIFPIGIVFGLGALAGMVCHRKPDVDKYCGFSVLAAVIATITWVFGCYAMLLFTAPSELAPPLLWPILQTFFTACISAAVSGAVKWYLAAKRCRQSAVVD